MSLGLLSCSTDEYDDWGNGEDNSGNSDSTYELLKDNISASVSFRCIPFFQSKIDV